jgi:hypothetical protein
VSRRVAWRWLIAVVAINLADWFAEFVGLHGNLMWPRFVLGLLLGATAAMLVASATRESPALKVWLRSTPVQHARI